MGFFSFISKQLPAIGTLLIIACFGSIYFLVYVPQNEKNIREQRFRALQNLDRNIHDKIENSKKLLKNWLDHYPDDALYIEKFPKDKFMLSAITTRSTKFLDTLKLSYDKLQNNLEDSSGVMIDSTANKIILYCISLNTHPQKDSTYYEVRMSFSFEQFFGSLLLLYGNIFDHFVILKDNNVIFQDFPAGVSEMDEDSLLGGKKAFHVSGVHDIALGGTDYKIFSQPVRIGQRFTVNGLVSNHRYQREKKQLPTQIILSLIILVVVIVLIFPWIKLFHMGSKDRLTLWDAITTLSASMLLMSLLFLSFLNYNSHYSAGNNSTQYKFLADRINDSLQAEIRDIYRRLKFFDSQRDDTLTESYLEIRNGTVTSFNSKLSDSQKKKQVDSRVIAYARDPIKYIYWLDKTGDEKSIWTTDSILAPHGNYKERAYFRKIMDKKAYYLNDSVFYLDQIVSWITGDFRSVISVPAGNGDSVAAVTFDMEALKDMVLPPGFLFAMINDSGRVLYHSESFRNLNENLLSEFSNRDKLRSCLIAHKSASFKTDYFSKGYCVYVKPISGLPYFIVIMQDMAYEQTRDTNIFTFSLSMLFFFFLFLTLETLTIYFIAPKKSFFKKQLFDATWIGPKRNNRLDYIAATVFNVSLILLLIILPPYTSFLGYLFILLFSATSSPLMLNYLYARRYKEKNPDHYLIKRKIINCFRAIVLFIDLASFFLLDWPGILKLMAYELLVALIGLSIYVTFQRQAFQETRISTSFIKGILRFSKNSFSFMALTRLAITSAIPIVFFYISSYDHEQKISTRNRQSLFLANVEQKLATKIAKNQATTSNNAIYYDSVTVKNSFDSARVQRKYDSLSPEEARAAALFKQFRLRISNESVAEEDFDEPSSDDGVFLYTNHSKVGAIGNDTTFRQWHKPGQYLYVESGDLGYDFPGIGSRDGVLFWCFLVISLSIFFVVIRGIIKKMFALQVPDLTRASEFDAQVFKDQTINKLVFVVGPPGAGKTNFIKDKIRNNDIKGSDGKKYLIFESVLESSDTAVFADMIHIPDSSSDDDEKKSWKEYSESFMAEKNELVVVNHFEYNIQDPVTNRTKLNFLEKLMLSDKRKIIILSTIHPVAFLDSAFVDSNKPSSSNGKKNKKGGQDGTENAMPEDLERWHVLLGHYRIILMKLNQSLLAEGIKNEKLDLTQIDKSVREMIEKETKWGQFLNKMQPAAFRAVLEKNQASPSADEWAFKMQVTSYYFYMYIWQSLTREEKFLLYDLAEDNLVNSSDDYNLSMLIGKGLIIRDQDDTLKIFNDGFRNFILTAIGTTEAMKIKDQIRENGYWAKLRTPLTILIVAILAFLLASQEETYTKLIAYFTALAGGIPVILRVFSLFGKSSQQSS